MPRLSLSSVGRTFGGLGTFLLLVDFVLESQYAKTRPRMAEAQSGRIFPLHVHGIVYVTSGERVDGERSSEPIPTDRGAGRLAEAFELAGVRNRWVPRPSRSVRRAGITEASSDGPTLPDPETTWCRQHRARPRRKREDGAPHSLGTGRKKQKGWATRRSGGICAKSELCYENRTSTNLVETEGNC
jgi:hypothetical protein